MAAELLRDAVIELFAFVERWHAAVKESLRLEEEIEQLDRFKGNLKEQIRTSRPVFLHLLIGMRQRNRRR